LGRAFVSVPVVAQLASRTRSHGGRRGDAQASFRSLASVVEQERRRTCGADAGPSRFAHAHGLLEILARERGHHAGLR
jgi:hypothetical protein